MSHDAERKIIIARTAMLLDEPFFGHLSCRLQLDANEAESGGIAATDGVRLIYNPSWVEESSLPHRMSMIAHETLHNAEGDFWRGEGLNREKWLQATDHRINNILRDAGFSIPSDWLCDPAYQGMSAERIYRLLPDPQPQGGQGKPGQGQGCTCGGVQAPPGASGDPGDGNPQPLDSQALRADWEVATLQAAQAAKMMGKLPAGMERLLDKIKNPQVDWRSALRRFVQECAKADYRWTQPNRRYLGLGLYLPSLKSEAMPPIILAVDTSGSIGQDEMDTFAAEMQSIVDEVSPEKVVVIYCDADIPKRRDGTLAVDEFEQGEPIVMKPAGGGGTDFSAPFAYVEDQGIEAACLVYLTDLMGGFGPEPDYPVLWASTTRNGTAPFGEIIPIKDERY